jgi:hypothetical protein
MPKTTNTPKYPNIIITMNLEGQDGNAFVIMGAVSKRLKMAGATKEEISQYTMDCMSGDYDNLIAVQSKWVSFND